MKKHNAKMQPDEQKQRKQNNLNLQPTAKPPEAKTKDKILHSLKPKKQRKRTDTKDKLYMQPGS